jgi:hypothetical protein
MVKGLIRARRFPKPRAFSTFLLAAHLLKGV